MKNIDIKEFEFIKEDLEQLKEEEVIFINDKDEPKYVLMSADDYDNFLIYRDLLDESVPAEDCKPAIKIVSNKENGLTYEEYEKIKKQLVEVFDKTFKPNPNKLN